MTHFSGALLLVLLSLTLLSCGTVNNDHDNEEVYSFTLTFDTNEADFDQSGTVLSYAFDVPEITPSVIRDGAVLVFYREQNTWTAMPYTYAVDDPDLQAVSYTVSLGYAFEDRMLEVFYESSTADIDLREQPDRLLKVVIIDSFGPGKKAGPDLRSWEQVRDYYGLSD